MTMKTILKEEGYPLAFFKTYLAMILGSIGSNQYRHLYVDTVVGPRDVIENGDLACAYFVSSILTLCGLTTGGVHTTVDETICDLKSSGWKKIHSPRLGCVVVWGKKFRSRGLGHRHIGFYVGDDNVVSNDSVSGSPKLHRLFEKDDLGEFIRKVEAYYFHPRLESVPS
ncbi:MAG: hypothetical protein CO143_01885 [Candidatus Moranbacteria bacterium CG_4_9_14_3_um_filter_45_14]|nr:MAG: hypothetical protein AUK19_02975 [Candidatus Moranbacteria bacterium CG2_30_45_14]PJA85308.1 MAG: hypothetical protein CO143_01885 [Candidatus Moranbacteria bacterium CG_4_9_14_3_um_filter_45_14]